MLETGRVTVEPPGAGFAARGSTADDAALRAAIAEVDAQWRTELAGEAPPLVIDATIWALQLIHRAAQFLVFREVEPQAIHDRLAVPCPHPPSPEICYSADLALRVLPDLLKLARAAAPDDPLVDALVVLAKQWPLSSIGCGMNIERSDVSAFIDHPALRQLYVDRVLERGDLSRLDDARVVADVRRAIGRFPELAPTIANRLRQDVPT